MYIYNAYWEIFRLFQNTKVTPYKYQWGGEVKEHELPNGYCIAMPWKCILNEKKGNSRNYQRGVVKIQLTDQLTEQIHHKRTPECFHTIWNKIL